MNVCATPLQGAYVLEPQPIADERGSFSRIYCKEEFAAIDSDFEIVQINHSKTRQKGTLRGLHFQYPPKGESKVVKCLQGAIFDVMIDLRRDSPTLLQWHGVELTAENGLVVYIPKGCAHGFQTLTQDVEMLYLHDEMYSRESEGGVRFDDPQVGIHWPLPMGEVSEKDRSRPWLDADFAGLSLASTAS